MAKIAVDVREQPWLHMLKCKVLLDGAPVERCIAASEIEGWVYVDLADERGLLTGESERRRGVVAIVPSPDMTREALERLLTDPFEAAIRARIAYADRTANREEGFFYEGVLEMYQRATQPGFTFANDDLEQAYAEHLKRLEELRA